jgi:cell division protein FtsI (penicillin-binding protein 3)
VSISNPRSGQYYGNIVAAPVFKNISDRIYASQIELSINNDNTPTAASPALYYRVSKSDETAFLFDKMASKAEIDIGSEYVVGLPKGDSVHFAPRRISSSRVPKLTGMTAKDAVYLLEEMGLKVTLIGSGFVMEQSITAGTEVHKGGKIVLKLSNS